MSKNCVNNLHNLIFSRFFQFFSFFTSLQPKTDSYQHQSNKTENRKKTITNLKNHAIHFYHTDTDTNTLIRTHHKTNIQIQKNNQIRIIKIVHKISSHKQQHLTNDDCEVKQTKKSVITIRRLGYYVEMFRWFFSFQSFLSLLCMNNQQHVPVSVVLHLAKLKTTNTQEIKPVKV